MLSRSHVEQLFRCCVVLFAIEIVHYIIFDAFNVVGISLYLHTRGFIDGLEYICPAMSG